MGDKLFYDPIRRKSRTHRTVFGTGASIIATSICQPLDRLKNRIQVHPVRHSMKTMAREIKRCEGYHGFFRGYTAALMRQMTNTTTRMVIYNSMFDVAAKNHSPSLKEKLKFGLISGTAGAVLGNPAEVALVRMMSTSQVCTNDPCYCRFRTDMRYVVPYDNGFNAIYRIAKEEGLITLWRGCPLAASRAVVMTLSHILTYYTLGDYFSKRRPDGVKVERNFYMVVCACFLTSVFAAPIDLIKTRYQRIDRWHPSKCTPRGILKEIVTTQGTISLWRGFFPHFTRLVLHTSITYLILSNTYRKL